MTKFEQKINNGKFSANMINCVILHKNKSFPANINAKTISEVVKKLPEGYELDILTTFQNYFNPVTVDKFEIEIVNSQYLYFKDFNTLIRYGFQSYISALEKEDFQKVMRLDNIIMNEREKECIQWR